MQHGIFIDGKWVPSSSKESFASLNPATEKSIGSFAQGNEDDIEAAVEAADDAYEDWAETPPPKRGAILLRAAQLLKQEKERLARLETTEMGKVLKEARGDVQEAIDILEYMAAEGRRLFGHTTTSELRNKFCMTVRRPVGVVGLITPWNFPIAIPAWKIAPALVCGNTIVFKPSSDTPLCAIEFVRLLARAGVPKGVINLVTGPGSTAGLALVRHKEVRGISFTGNKETGATILREAGIKRVGLEMGGKNGIIIMDDADFNLAVDGVIWGAFGTTGQRCTACSRVIVHEKVKSKFERMVVQRASKLRVGDGLNPRTEMGPLVNKAALEKSQKYSEIGKDEGAKLVCGGKKISGHGYFFQPTIFTDVRSDMRIAQEEIFGPVLSIISVKNLDEAIDVMNGIEYGLSSSIYTNDVKKAFLAIEKIEAGITYINSSTIGAEVHLPFGGVKHSGNTREAGIEGINEFSEIKSVFVDYSGKLQKAQIDVE